MWSCPSYCAALQKLIGSPTKKAKGGAGGQFSGGQHHKLPNNAPGKALATMLSANINRLVSREEQLGTMTPGSHGGASCGCLISECYAPLPCMVLRMFWSRKRYKKAQLLCSAWPFAGRCITGLLH